MHSRSLVLSAALIFVACVALSARGDAQPSRRVQSPLQSAERAYIEGRYAEVETLTDKLDGRDPAVAVLKARALIARGQYAAAETLLRPVASKAPASDAALALGLLQQMLGKPDAPALLQRVAASADSATAPAELARAARALWALNQWQPANAAYRSAAAAAPTDANINTAWGELFLEKYAPDEAMKSFQAVLQRDPTWVPALIGAARALADDNPPQSIAFAKKALAVNPSSVAAHVFLARQAIDDGHHDEARASLQQALTVNPSSLDAHALLAALAYVEDKTSEYEAEVAKTLAIAPSHGDVYREVGELAAHNYRFDDAVALTRRALALDPDDAQALADLGMHLLRTGDEPGARHALDTVVQARSVQPGHPQPSEDDGRARHVHHREGRRSDRPDEQGRSACAAGIRAAARAQGARDAVGEIRIHAARPHPDRDFPDARRFRGAHGRPARHDRCARRHVRPRGDDGFAEGPAGRVPVGSDAVARAGACRHAADVESAGTALADGRHFSLRRESARGRSGDARWRSSSPPCSSTARR